MTTTICEKRPDLDRSGFRFFSEGDLGEAHAMAHEMLDRGLEPEGHEQLRSWLARQDERDYANSSEWIHVQWHMAVFEIAVGRLEEAHARFRRYILPLVEVGQALTDAPSLLWRLQLAGGPELELEWGPVRDVAVAHLSKVQSPYVELHNLLALAGARDLVAIDRWLDTRYERATSEVDRQLLQLAWGLRTYAHGDFEPSARLLETIADQVTGIGGSAAQNELFGSIRDRAQKLKPSWTPNVRGGAQT